MVGDVQIKVEMISQSIFPLRGLPALSTSLPKRRRGRNQRAALHQGEAVRQFLHRAEQGLPQIEARRANRLEYTGLFNRSSMRRSPASG
jgi:hypothetical protein